MKKLFNRHKLRRKLQRRAGRASRSIAQVPSRKYSGTNPYASRCERSGLKKRLEILTLCLSLIALLGVFMYHPFFHVTNLSVSGLQRIDERDFLQTAQGTITYKKFGFLPAQSYLFVSTQNIQEILEEKYPIEEIVLTKSFPQTLTIAVEEKISTVIFDNGKQYGYLDVQGNLVEVLREVGDDEWHIETEIVTTTLADGTVRTEERTIRRDHIVPIDLVHAEMGVYPIVYDTTQRSLQHDEPVVSNRVVQHAITWFTLMNKQTDIPFGYIALSDIERHAMVHTREGWGIKINIHSDPTTQFENIAASVIKDRQRPDFVSGSSFP